jgi:outer membrane protein TolC
VSRCLIWFVVAAWLPGGTALAQPATPQPSPATAPQTPPAPAIAASPDTAPLTLQAALTQARANAQQARSALTAADLAAEDRKQARAALFPAVSEFNGYIYTQPNGTTSGVWVPNDGPKVYQTWLAVHEDFFAPAKWAQLRSAAAAEAVARAKADVAGRGLVATVVQNYYTLVAAQRKAASAEQSLREAQQFLDITQRQENAGEVAHSDVIKAQIQVAQRRRDAQEAELTALKSRLGLTVLVFPDFRENITVVDDLQEIVPLPPLEGLKATATGASPDVRSAEASVQQGLSDISVARGGVLPSASFDYFYGINANQFAINSPPESPGGSHRLLGSVFQVQMTVPLWSWGATQSKLRQASIRVQQAKADLTLAQRQLLANVSAFYREAQVAQDQVASLKQSLDLATESLRLTLLRYQTGEATVLEVVDAQTTLIQARNAADDGLVRYRVALAALQTLTGTL